MLPFVGDSTLEALESVLASHLVCEDSVSSSIKRGCIYRQVGESIIHSGGLPQGLVGQVDEIR